MLLNCNKIPPIKQPKYDLCLIAIHVVYSVRATDSGNLTNIVHFTFVNGLIFEYIYFFRINKEELYSIHLL